jgi:hypothetical protein
VQPLLDSTQVERKNILGLSKSEWYNSLGASSYLWVGLMKKPVAFK